MGYDRQYLSWVLVYVICGMSLGVVMAASHNLVPTLSQSQILLVGFVLSLVYGLIHKCWHACPSPFNLCPSFLGTLARIHQAGALTMFTALLLMYGNVFLDEQLEPAFATASIMILIGALTMSHMFKSTATEQR